LKVYQLQSLEVLDQAETLSDLNVPGFNFHGLHGVPKRYSIHVNGPWCITFEWKQGEALRVDLEQYHLKALLSWSSFKPLLTGGVANDKGVSE
jgi:plasmid maintenance system killer protein